MTWEIGKGSASRTYSMGGYTIKKSWAIGDGRWAVTHNDGDGTIVVAGTLWGRPYDMQPQYPPFRKLSDAKTFVVKLLDENNKEENDG